MIDWSTQYSLPLRGGKCDSNVEAEEQLEHDTSQGSRAFEKTMRRV